MLKSDLNLSPLPIGAMYPHPANVPDLVRCYANALGHCITLNTPAFTVNRAARRDAMRLSALVTKAVDWRKQWIDDVRTDYESDCLAHGQDLVIDLSDAINSNFTAPYTAFRSHEHDGNRSLGVWVSKNMLQNDIEDGWVCPIRNLSRIPDTNAPYLLRKRDSKWTLYQRVNGQVSMLWSAAVN